MPLELDHLTIIAPSLVAGVDHVRACLDVDIPYGGRHEEMGTHNHLLRLDDKIFLEVIAIDAAAKTPVGPRWFDLDDIHAVQSAWDDGRCLRGWVARTRDLDAVLASHGELLGRKTRITRGDRSWLFAVRPDGSLPAGGAVPPVLDWGDRGSPACDMPDLGAHLRAFALEHPDPIGVAKLYEQLGVVNPPRVNHGTQLRYRATIDTARGIRELH